MFDSGSTQPPHEGTAHFHNVSDVSENDPGYKLCIAKRAFRIFSSKEIK